jgi:2,3-bisphosphoglycerate-independent phosphoglycerate mutase
MDEHYQLRGGNALAKGVQAYYQEGQVDYSLKPLVLADPLGNPIGRIVDGDTVIFCCRRGEREIQLTEAFTDVGFDRFPHIKFKSLNFVLLILYHEKFSALPVAFAPSRLEDTLGEIISRANLSQLRVAESEKFSHVTFFFNGGNYQPLPGQRNICVPSPKGVLYEQVPELSLVKVADEVISGLKQSCDLIVTNFANGDVIGHTQNPQAKIRCAEIVDAQLGRVVDAALVEDYTIMVTADHGNIEEMINPDGTHNSSHSTNPVPFLLIDPHSHTHLVLQDGQLADIAPTILSALGIGKPKKMKGTSLAGDHDWKNPRRVLLIIFDGWGLGKLDDTNPIFMAQTPVWDQLTHQYPPSRLKAAGEDVGLKAGKAGNSEAGHMNIGAGRVVLQDDSRLDLAMQDGSFFRNQVLCQNIENVKRKKSNLHLIGLLSEKSSHGSIDYPLAILEMAREIGLDEVNFHLIFDGRSSEPGSAPTMLEELECQISKIGVGRIVSGIGRAYALDRDGNYAKTKLAYDAFVHGVGNKYSLR